MTPFLLAGEYVTNLLHISTVLYSLMFLHTVKQRWNLLLLKKKTYFGNRLQSGHFFYTIRV